MPILLLFFANFPEDLFIDSELFDTHVAADIGALPPDNGVHGAGDV